MNRDQLDYPPGYKPGCLPRRSRPGQFCPLAAERITVIPEGEWPDLLGKVSLRAHVNQILDQDGVGSCATEATAQAVMICRDVAGLPFELLNPWYIYHTTSGGRDNGSAIDDNLAFARNRGIAPESVWPRSKGWRVGPSAEAVEAANRYRIDEFFDISTTEEMGSALLLGFAVVFGWSGHSCVMTRLVSATEAEYANSWAASWGDRGFGRVSLRSVNWSYGAWAVRSGIIPS